MMSLKRLLPIVTLGMFFLFASCDKDNLTIDSHSADEVVAASRGYLGLANTQNNLQASTTTEEDECFTINYPVTIQYPDNTNQEINSEEELDAAIDSWFDNNVDAQEFPTLLFPITVTLADGTTQTINDDEELCDLFFDCYGDDEWDDEDEWDEGYDDFSDCFTIVYPITITTTTGTETINSDEELDAFFDSLVETEIGEEDIVFGFPVSVILTENDSTISINNEDELDGLFEDCFDDYYDYDDEWDEEDLDFSDCFSIIYPISVTANGETATINNDDELDVFFENLEEIDIDEEDVVFGFPVSVTLTEDNTVVVINNDDELEVLFFNCFGEDYDDEDWDECDDADDFTECFTFVYPFDVNTPSGTTTLNSDDDLDAIFDTIEDEDDLELVYPITITLTEDGTTVVVNSDDELEDAWDACE